MALARVINLNAYFTKTEGRRLTSHFQENLLLTCTVRKEQNFCPWRSQYEDH